MKSIVIDDKDRIIVPIPDIDAVQTALDAWPDEWDSITARPEFAGDESEHYHGMAFTFTKAGRRFEFEVLSETLQSLPEVVQRMSRIAKRAWAMAEARAQGPSEYELQSLSQGEQWRLGIEEARRSKRILEENFPSERKAP